jgi:chromate transporter
MIGGWAIFLPGTLLLFFVYPFWGRIKQIPWVDRARVGVNAVAGGLVAGVFAQILIHMNWSPLDALTLVISIGLLIGRRVPAPFIVLIVGGLYSIFLYLK